MQHLWERALREGSLDQLTDKARLAELTGAMDVDMWKGCFPRMGFGPGFSFSRRPVAFGSRTFKVGSADILLDFMVIFGFGCQEKSLSAKAESLIT